MKKVLFFLFIILSLSFALTGCGNNSSNSENTQNSYSAERTATLDNHIDNNSIENNEDLNQETEIASFSTKVYTPNDKARQNNIQITCSRLNETIVKSGETFSFCNTVGKAKPEDGYQKADIFDENGNKIKGYGGGNCQISSTLYNAVLSLPSITIIERHDHSQKVYYVPIGKDAAVAYGSIDFKFRNDYDYDIKIYSSATTNTVDIKVVKL